MHALNPKARVINMGPDPVFSRFPVRNFRSDLSIAGENAVMIPTLVSAMESLPRDEDQIAARRAALAAYSDEVRNNLCSQAGAKNVQGITKAWASKCLGEALRGRKSSVFSELGTILGPLERTEHKSWFQEPHSGGLGWSFPCALGAQLADRERICVATMGDGSYIFSNPTACHQVAEALELPILVMVLNNEEWGAVRASVTGLYPDGYASKANRMPLTALKPSPDFTETAKASRAWAKRVTDAAALPEAIAEALRVVETEKRLALLDVATLP
jgi:acetolactate synthase-1/2/3 large subunit